jgi:hypothetical protein
MKDKNYTIILIDAEKVVHKIETFLMIKITLNKLSIEGLYLSIIKTISDKHLTECRKVKIISSKIRNKTQLSTLTAITQYSTGSFSLSN